MEVDRVICLDGNPWVWVQGIRQKYPKLSEKVICIYPKHRDLPEGLAKTRQRQVGAWQHFGVPLHEDTIETILTELATVVREDALAAAQREQLARREDPPEAAPLPDPGPFAEPVQLSAQRPTRSPTPLDQSTRVPRVAADSQPARRMAAALQRSNATSSAHNTSQFR